MGASVAKIAKTLGLNEKELINKSLREFIDRELIACESESSLLSTKYGVKSAKEMEEKFKKGVLEEKDTWEDFFRLDYLESRIKELRELLKEL